MQTIIKLEDNDQGLVDVSISYLKEEGASVNDSDDATTAVMLGATVHRLLMNGIVEKLGPHLFPSCFDQSQVEPMPDAVKEYLGL